MSIRHEIQVVYLLNTRSIYIQYKCVVHFLLLDTFTILCGYYIQGLDLNWIHLCLFHIYIYIYINI